jgi:lipopolysaccharide transport system ATP-binding protein
LHGAQVVFAFCFLLSAFYAMSDTVISVENLSKRYRLGAIGTSTLREDLSRSWARFRGMPDPTLKVGAAPQERREGGVFWALRDIGFEVKRGEVLGIVGANGAGKSTLLKILSRITAPTSGEVKIKGRIASLLEVGTGFHPDLSGRENVFLNGAILGMSKAEIRRKLDEIVAFSGLDDFINAPVKRYSSGMYVRLAFAVAAHLDPEILILDEVLAVGDAQFQKKCMGKMEDESRNHGRTILFVSHNLQAISTLTKRCLLLSDGACAMMGNTSDVVSAYLEKGARHDLSYSGAPSAEMPQVVRVEVATSEAGNVHIHGKPLRLTFDIATPHAIESAVFSFKITDAMSQPVAHFWIFDAETPFCRKAGVHRLVCHIPRLRLYMGKYAIMTHLSEAEGGRYFQTLEGICPFEVAMYGIPRRWRWNHGDCKYLEENSWTVAGEIQ